jgi:O-antigen ligase
LDNKDLIIALLTVGCVASSGLLPGPRDWMMSMRRRPFAALLIIASIAAVFMGSQRGAAALELDTIRTLRILVLCGLAAAGCIASLIARRRSRSGGSLIWMACYACLAMGSAVYSIEPLLSFYKGWEVAAYVVFGVYIGSTLHTLRDIEDTVNIMLFVMWYLVVSALVGAVIAPSDAFAKKLSEESMAFTLRGVFPAINPNTLTQVSGTMVGCLLCWLFLSKTTKRLVFIAVLIVALTCMVLAHSRTSWVALLIASCVVFVSFKKTWLGLFVLTLAGGFAAFTAMNDYIFSYAMRGNNPETFTSLSGRTYFWSLVISKVWQSPVFGYGFYSSQKLMFGTSTVDNTYLEVLLGLGVVGLIVFCVAIIAVLIKLWRSRPILTASKQSRAHRFAWTQLTVILIFLLVRSLTGPTFQVLHVDLALFVLVTVCASALSRMSTENPVAVTGTRNVRTAGNGAASAGAACATTRPR